MSQTLADRAAYMKRWRATHPPTPVQQEKARARARAWHAAQYSDPKRKARLIQKRREWLARTGHANDLRLRCKRHGISTAVFYQLVEEQSGQCVICGAKLDSDLQIDHDHQTGRVRGLLCRGCNTAIGLLHDSIELCLAAGIYLERGRKCLG